MAKIIIRFWPPLILVILTFILRVVNLENLFYFTYDESVPAFVARRLILWQHIPLIGGVTPFGFHLGPYFYWFYSGLLFLGNLNPIVWGWAGAVIATATTLLMYVVGKNFANKKVAFSAAALWTFSYLANVYDRHLWALYWGPLISLVVLFSLFKIVKGELKFIYLLGITIALGIHADPSNIVFLILAIVIWIIYRLPVKKNIIIAASFIFLSFLPLIIFDLRHNFANSRPFLEFWKQGKNNPGFSAEKFIDNALLFPRAATRLVYTFSDNEISKQYSYCPQFVREKFSFLPPFLVLAAALTTAVFMAWSFKRNDPGWRITSLLVVLYFLGLQIYGTIFRADVFEHYITGAFPVLFLILSKIISILPKKLWLIALAVFVLINLYQLSIAQNGIGLTAKKQAVEFTMSQVGDKPFSLDSLSTCWKYSGYRYLFAVFGREPVKSYVDPNFAYLYGTTPVAEKHPATVVSFVIHDFYHETAEFWRRYAELKAHEVKSSLFGNIEVIIMDNSSGWFDRP